MTPAFLLVIVWLVLFAATLLAVSLGLKYVERSRRDKVSSMLQAVSSQPIAAESTILKELERRQEGDFNSKLEQLPLFRKVAAHISQAGLDWSCTQLLVLTIAGGIAGTLIGSLVRVPVFREFAIAAFGLTLAAAPWLYVSSKRRTRLSMFEEQFPEGLDFLARSMRAGHAFSVSLEMLAEESLDPLAQDIRRVFHEQNLGAPLDAALRNLAERVPLLDVKFFVSAVLMQRETGGNLSEILTKLSYVIRERFRLKGQVRAVSAHGRLTALVLTILPFVTMLALMFVAPTYLESMARDPDGKYLIVGSIAGQVLGYYFMRRIIDIKV